MSVSKSELSLNVKRNRVIVIAIHNLLNSIKWYTKEKLKTEVNQDLKGYSLDLINDVRTIEKGIKTLETLFNINIVKEGKPQRYKYKTPDVKIAKQLFLHSDMEHMVLMYHVLLSLDGLSLTKFSEKVFNSLASKGFSKLDELKYFEKGQETNALVQFESHSKFENDQGDLFLYLFEAIDEKKVLELEYKSFDQDENKRYSVSPYLLKQYNKRWYLFVLNHQKNDIDYFGLDRIKDVKLLPEDSFDEEKYKFLFGEEGYFSDKVGVSNFENKYENLPADKVCNVKIKIENMQFNYIETKPIHDSQRVINRNDTSTEILIQVVINFELIALLLSYGSTITILEPIELRDKLINKYKKALENYQ